MEDRDCRLSGTEWDGVGERDCRFSGRWCGGVIADLTRGSAGRERLQI